MSKAFDPTTVIATLNAAQRQRPPMLCAVSRCSTPARWSLVAVTGRLVYVCRAHADQAERRLWLRVATPAEIGGG